MHVSRVVTEWISHSFALRRSQIKPDGVQRGLVGEIIKRFEQRGYQLVGASDSHLLRAVRRSRSTKASALHLSARVYG